MIVLIQKCIWGVFMKNIVKILIAVVIAVVVIVLVVLSIYIFKPNADYKKYRNDLQVHSIENIGASGDKIHFLSTGSSDAILLESDGRFALVDCAEDTDNPRGFEGLELDGYEEKVLEYLKTNAADADGKITLDFVVGTHAHSDHIGGFDTIISDENIHVNRAYLKTYDESGIYDNEVENWDNKEVYNQMVDALNEKNVPIISQMDSTPFTLGNYKITLFNTDYDSTNEKVGENDNSLGVLIEKNGTKVFLSGDIDNVTGDEAKLAPDIGKIDLLKVGHHSYSRSTSGKWLKTLDPAVCVITNNYESVDFRTVRRITRVSKSAVLITGQENGVVAVIGDNGEIGYYNGIH